MSLLGKHKDPFHKCEKGKKSNKREFTKNGKKERRKMLFIKGK